MNAPPHGLWPSRGCALLLSLACALALGACRDGSAPAALGGGDGTPDPEAASGGTTSAPPLGPIFVADLTAPDQRPVDLALKADTLLRQALHADGLFGSAANDDPAACGAEFQLFYAVLVNGEPDKDAEAGEARIGIEGVAHCPDPTSPHHATEAFKVSDEAGRAFGGEHGGTGPATLAALLDEQAPQLAARLYGQVLMRHASDARILEVLAHDQRPGLLMEAASEAGERKLTQAVPDLVRLTASDDDVTALRACAALGLLGDSRREVLAALARMTEGSDTERHLTALNALGDIGGEEAARYLDALAVGHPLVPIRDAARQAAQRARRATTRSPDAPAQVDDAAP
ncbi:MAG: hypothetical protein H6746_06520 [Deltaproteobacteria bacterium]|nr:hypothetical protein [Deltaproteobacteria bacterium]